MRAIFQFGAIVAASVLAAGPVHAEVAVLKEDFFVVRHTETVAASPETAWDVLVSPADWWSGEHSFSGDAENFILDARAGGCFCEMLPAGDERPEPGSVRHLEVIFLDPGKAMRLSGALGPLQSEPLHGVLTITFKPVDDETRILFEYAVGGPSRFDPQSIAPAVDAVIGEQLERLAALLGQGKASTDEVPIEAAPADLPPQPALGAETRAVPPIEPVPDVVMDREPMPEASEDDGIGADFLSGT